MTKTGFTTTAWARPTVRLAAMMAAVLLASNANADVKLPNIFSDHMVLQQGQKNKVWGMAAKDESITVTIDRQAVRTKAGEDGSWSVMLDPIPVGGPYEMSIKGATITGKTVKATNEVKISDILVGEVWICSGQSNMQWNVAQSNDPDLEKLTANHPKIRMINFPQIGTQEPIWSHDDRRWMVCSPATVESFSAVGYFFARQLHRSLDVPVGMINNAWGGSSAEGWVRRDLLAGNPKLKPLVDRWVEDEPKTEAKIKELAAKGDTLTEEQKKELDGLKGKLGGNARPGNIYNGVLKSHIGYGIKGAIWYQGESNAGRGYQYRELFPFMIKSWRDEWKQGDFPFYWVQLADFYDEVKEPGDSTWAELREAQTMTMDRLPNTGQAVIIDIGEGKDIHPKNKVDVGRRLARWALAKNYGITIAYRSPQYKSIEFRGNKAVLTFNYLDGGWRPFDVKEPIGFTIAGEGGNFVPAKARILDDNTIEVSAESVPNPVAVRYGWADNPVVNMFNGAGLPLTPFRTDGRPGKTIDAY